MFFCTICDSVRLTVLVNVVKTKLNFLFKLKSLNEETQKLKRKAVKEISKSKISVSYLISD